MAYPAVLAGDEDHRGRADGGDLLGVMAGTGHGSHVREPKVVGGGSEHVLDARVEGKHGGLGHPLPGDLDTVGLGEFLDVGGEVLLGGGHEVVVWVAQIDGDCGFVGDDVGLAFSDVEVPDRGAGSPEADTLLLGDEADLDVAQGLDTGVVEGPHDLDAAEHAQRAVEGAAVGDGSMWEPMSTQGRDRSRRGRVA